MTGPQKINLIASMIGSAIWLTVLLYQVWVNHKLRGRVTELEGHMNQHCQAIHYMNKGCRQLAINVDIVAKRVGILGEEVDSQTNIQ